MSLIVPISRAASASASALASHPPASPAMGRPASAQRSSPLGMVISHERQAWAAALVNLFAMAVEIGAGRLLASAALLAEGYHMGAHVAAMSAAGLGYRLAARLRLRRGEAAARRVVGLAGLVNAVILVGIAGLLLIESLQHLMRPETIPFLAAAPLAVFGLAINIVSLALLHHPHGRGHGHRRDLSFHAIYLHMIGDAAVGVLSLLGLCLVAGLHWLWADGAAGLCGAILILGLAAQILAALRAEGRSRAGPKP